jgi:hypothetical protein
MQEHTYNIQSKVDRTQSYRIRMLMTKPERQNAITDGTRG